MRVCTDNRLVAAVPEPSPAAPHSRWGLRARGDERLVALVRDGDASAFEALYDRYHARILAFCRHMLSSREDAEDATQHTFISAYRELLRSKQDIELRPWLYAIARNRSISMLRARREAASIDAVGEPSVEGLADVVQRRQDLRELVADLHELPDDQREALVLFELGDLSQAEIADVLGREPSQVKALVFQARTTLMQYRTARELDCAAIREELATARGPALLRGHLRRHLRTCSGCAEYAELVRSQRAQLGLLLPVIPTAGLKAAVMAAGPGAAGGGAGLLALFGGKSIALKALAVVVTAGAVGTTVDVVEHHHHHSRPAHQAAKSVRHAAPRSSLAPAPAPAAWPAVATPAATAGRRVSSRYKRTHHSKHHTATGSSNPTTVSSPPTSTPVKGAKRRSTGHAQKSQRAKVRTHGSASTAPGHLKEPKTRALPQPKPVPLDTGNRNGQKTVDEKTTGKPAG
jgi:RNA polymerase sigma factor (sigma-70 family)